MGAAFTEEFVEVAGSKIHLMKGGSGDPLLILHGAGGNSGWNRYAQELADHYTVYIPCNVPASWVFGPMMETPPMLTPCAAWS